MLAFFRLIRTSQLEGTREGLGRSATLEQTHMRHFSPSSVYASVGQLQAPRRNGQRTTGRVPQNKWTHDHTSETDAPRGYPPPPPIHLNISSSIPTAPPSQSRCRQTASHRPFLSHAPSPPHPTTNHSLCIGLVLTVSTCGTRPRRAGRRCKSRRSQAPPFVPSPRGIFVGTWPRGRGLPCAPPAERDRQAGRQAGRCRARSGGRRVETSEV